MISATTSYVAPIACVLIFPLALVNSAVLMVRGLGVCDLLGVALQTSLAHR